MQTQFIHSFKNIYINIRAGYSFDAEPKVVKGRAKYKAEEENESKSQQTFSLLMQDKKVKMMNPV